MAKFYATLKVEYGECPPDCTLCEEACIKVKTGNGQGASRIQPVHAHQIKFHSVMTCHQCSQPACAEICPTRAITKSESDGVVRIDEQKCVACGLCTLACSYGGVYYDVEAVKSVKCDRCDGDPVCVKACPNGVLSFINNSEAIRSYFTTEDLFTQGV